MRRDHEAPEDDLDAVPQALMQPGRILGRRRGDERGVERGRHFVRRRQIDRVRRKAFGRVLVVGFGLFHRAGEVGLVHAHADLQVVGRTGIGDLHLRMPDEGNVGDDAPNRDRQHKRQHAERAPGARRQRAENLKPAARSDSPSLCRLPGRATPRRRPARARLPVETADFAHEAWLHACRVMPLTRAPSGAPPVRRKKAPRIFPANEFRPFPAVPFDI